MPLLGAAYEASGKLIERIRHPLSHADSTPTKYFFMVEPDDRKLPIARSAPRIETDRIVTAAFGPRELHVAGL